MGGTPFSVDSSFNMFTLVNSCLNILRFFVADMLEPVIESKLGEQMTSFDSIMIIFLTGMFSIGMGGNIWAIVCVIWIWCKRRLPKRGVFRHMSAYIFLLSVSDVFVSFFYTLKLGVERVHRW